MVNSPVFGFPHRAEIPKSDGDQCDKNHGQDAVERVRDGSEKRHVGVGLDAEGFESRIDQSDLKSHPGRDERDGGDRCRRAVHNVAQLLARHPHPIRERSHGVAHDQGVGVVVEKDEHAERPRGELSAAAPLRPATHGLHNALCAASL